MRKSISSLNELSPADFTHTLAGIYEHSPWVAEAIAKEGPFPSISALHEAMRQAVESASPERQLALLNAHPDLAGKLAQARQLTAESTAEQSAAGLDLLTDAERSTFTRLNTAYRERFDFPFIICAREHDKAGILEAFETRLDHSPASERSTALAQVHRIAWHRLNALLQDDAPTKERPMPTGKLSTHILDTVKGGPADGVAIDLLLEGEPLLSTSTNADGRTDQPLLAGDTMAVGTYELRFHIGAYFTDQKAAGAGDFLDVVPIVFRIADPEANYHVPLLCSPWSYTTYRGS